MHDGKNAPVSLGDHFADFTDSRVRSGCYCPASDVVRSELRMLEKHETNVKALRDALIEGERSGEPQLFDRDGFLKRMHEKHIG